MKKMGVIVKTDGTLERLDLSTPQEELKRLQKAVGGYVEVVELKDKLTMWLNEESKLGGFYENRIATTLWEIKYGIGTDVIFGDVVFTGTADRNGNTTNISESNLQKLTELSEQVRWGSIYS